MNDKPTPENEATAHEAVQLGTPPDGFRAVAAFRQPIPMRAMTKLCDALVMAYGEDAKIDPAGNWIGVFGRIPDEEKAEAFANTMKGEGPPTDCDPTATYEVVTVQEHGQEPRQHRVIPGTGKAEDFEADPGGHPARKFWWRACEQRPLAAEDGAKFYTADQMAAALELVKRHPEAVEYPAIFVWPDGENPTHGDEGNVTQIPRTKLRPFTDDDRGNVVDFYDTDDEKVARIDREATVNGVPDQSTFEKFHDAPGLDEWLKENGYAYALDLPRPE